MQVEEKSLNGQKIAIGKGFILLAVEHGRLYLPFKSIEMTATFVVALGGRLAGTNMAHGDMKVQEWWAASM